MIVGANTFWEISVTESVTAGAVPAAIIARRLWWPSLRCPPTSAARASRVALPLEPDE